MTGRSGSRRRSARGSRRRWHRSAKRATRATIRPRPPCPTGPCRRAGRGRRWPAGRRPGHAIPATAATPAPMRRGTRRRPQTRPPPVRVRRERPGIRREHELRDAHEEQHREQVRGQERPAARGLGAGQAPQHVGGQPAPADQAGDDRDRDGEAEVLGGPADRGSPRRRHGVEPSGVEGHRQDDHFHDGEHDEDDGGPPRVGHHRQAAPARLEDHIGGRVPLLHTPGSVVCAADGPHATPPAAGASRGTSGVGNGVWRRSSNGCARRPRAAFRLERRGFSEERRDGGRSQGARRRTRRRLWSPSLRTPEPGLRGS